MLLFERGKKLRDRDLQRVAQGEHRFKAGAALAAFKVADGVQVQPSLRRQGHLAPTPSLTEFGEGLTKGVGKAV